MTPEQAIRELSGGTPRPVYVVLGEEHVLASRVLAAARSHVVEAATAAFNTDLFDADTVSAERILSAAQTVPMMAARRLVIARNVERLEKPGDDGADEQEARAQASGKGAKATKTVKKSPIDLLAEYVASPSISTCFILVATKLDLRRRLATAAKKADAIVACDPLKPQQLPPFVRDEAKRRGNPIASDVADAVVDLVGHDLGALVDAVERLSLYVGERAPIDELAVQATLTRVRVGSIWGLTDAVSNRDRATALRLLNENFDPRDRGMPLLGLLISSTRRMLKLRALLESGVGSDDAAKQAGIPPFRARDAAAQVRRLPAGELERALGVWAETDLALKGSRRAPLLVLEEALLRLTAG